MARKHKHPEHVNHERWLVSYADFITLLFAFFTVLYAISSTDAKKVQKLVGSMERAFSSGMFLPGSRQLFLNDASSSSGNGIYDLGIPMVDMEKQITEAVKAETMANSVSVKKTPDGIVVTLKTIDVFKSGSAELMPEVHSLILKISNELKKTNQLIRIEGHTDSSPIRSAYFQNNWDLSVARAMAVLKEMLDQGVAPERLSVTGHAEFSPVASNDNEEGRSKNRRVEIILVEKKLPEFPVINPDSIKPGISAEPKLDKKGDL